MTKYIVANWESHGTLQSAERWLKDFFHYYKPRPDVKVIVAPPFVFTHPLKQTAAQAGQGQIALAVQDISPFPVGDYTGAVAAEMVRGMVEYVIVGHFSRRRYFHETHQEIANKVSEAASAGLTPILCLDPSYARAQFAALEEPWPEDLILAYDPYAAPGMKAPPSLQEATGAMANLASLAPDHPILYGGPLRKDNAQAYLHLKGSAGLLVGSASLDPVDFATICGAAAKEEALT